MLSQSCISIISTVIEQCYKITLVTVWISRAIVTMPTKGYALPTTEQNCISYGFNNGSILGYFISMNSLQPIVNCCFWRMVC